MPNINQLDCEVRVRFDDDGGPELNVEDLRSSGDRSLVRLAEADRTRSNTLSAKGDDNGWLRQTEVDAAVGIHFTIKEGYQELIRFAEETASPVLRGSEVAQLLAIPFRRREQEAEALKNAIVEKRPFDVGGRTVIPEIMTLDDFAPVPATVFDQHSINEVAESIVARVGSTMDVPENLKPSWTIQRLFELSFDPKREGMVQLYLPMQHAASVAQHGIRNLHQQTDIQNKEFRSNWRGTIEDNLARLRLGDGGPDREALWDQLRPKSAILEIDWPDGFAFRTSGGERYGGLVAVMAPETYSRITVTPHDSAALGPEKTYATPARIRAQVRPLTDGRMWVHGNSGEYLEAQIWGSASPSDIQEFWVPEGTDQETIIAAHAAGHPVYSYSVVKENDRYRRKRGELLSKI